jgi:hypothetical protein
LRNNSNFGKIDNSDYYILEFEPNEKYPLFEDAKPTKLSHEEIIAIEKIIKPQIKKTTAEWRLEKDIASDKNFYYNRQYIAAVNENGEKLVWINFFCHDTWKDSYDLTKTRLNISDGGKCYFKLKVNISQKKIINYRFNGLG